jgi:hypothetical protein
LVEAIPAAGSFPSDTKNDILSSIAILAIHDLVRASVSSPAWGSGRELHMAV